MTPPRPQSHTLVTFGVLLSEDVHLQPTVLPVVDVHVPPALCRGRLAQEPWVRDTRGVRVRLCTSFTQGEGMTNMKGTRRHFKTAALFF